MKTLTEFWDTYDCPYRRTADYYNYYVLRNDSEHLESMWSYNVYHPGEMIMNGQDRIYIMFAFN